MGFKDRKYFLEAQTHIEAKSWDAAEQSLNEVIKASPEHAEALLHRAYTRLRKGALSEALVDIQKASICRPDSGVIKMLEGEIHLALKDNQAALNTLKQAVALEPDNGRALYFLGMAYKILGQKEDAAEAFETALQFDRDFVMARWMVL